MLSDLPTSPPEGVFRHERRMELVELSGRTTGQLATPSEGRQGWHNDALSSPQPPPPALFLRDDCGPPGAVGDGHRRRFRRGRRTFPGTTGPHLVCDMFRHKRRMELDELSGRTTGRLGYIGPTLLREYVGRNTSRTTGRAMSCTMDHATDRCTPDQHLLLRHRAVGPADVQRWMHTYGDRGPAPLVRRK